jgi:hypothetical protein
MRAMCIRTVARGSRSPEADLCPQLALPEWRTRTRLTFKSSMPGGLPAPVFKLDVTRDYEVRIIATAEFNVEYHADNRPTLAGEHPKMFAK